MPTPGLEIIYGQLSRKKVKFLILGSGKTYTMMGSDGLENRGIIPRFYTDLLKRLKIMKENGTIEAANCEVSYFEVYNERIYDLLQKQETQKEPSKENFYEIILY